MNAVAKQIDSRTTVVTFLAYEGRGDGVGPKDLLAVRPGVPLAMALEQASNLLSMIIEPILEAGDGHPLEGSRAYLIHHALESAKAIVDAVRDGAEAAQ
ncbi:DUF3077 domain-containing protein [Pseudomonas stutzeri]|uniref:DUF3077 domain-containing protein n=1 Tax=Stutzerimonas stutzeri TaxID=316 RepID=UPI000C9C1E78|nr:DUF3077 domain-containing protein [Stutzerimonas stutzeri]MCQ4280475.1 DUF3077 domain-containing protein [Stutzerimonas stutzeri]PNF71516.1 hypothetical protein CXK96_16900 [Stutzerimonas stutzeri]